MSKKRRMPIYYGQIMLSLLALAIIFLSAGNFLIMIIGFAFIATAILLETVAYEKTPDVTNTRVPYVPPPPSNLCPTRRHPLTFIEQYKAWYCFKCKEYR
jgi:hypothetical protein